ncbi:MAG: type II toxin-antitoxin system VapC family toxin [Acidobacteriota bacterium]
MFSISMKNSGSPAQPASIWSLRAVGRLPIKIYDGQPLQGQALRFSRRFALPATYDAYYLALADSLGGEFWTRDRRLFEAVGRQLSWVHLVE